MTQDQPRSRTDNLPRLPSGVGLVVIGRNEGDRLVRCLASVHADVFPLVYVDSGSTDGSVDRARDMGATIVELDMSTRFTAARARNAGLERLLAAFPDMTYVQFVDGDCEVVDDWLVAAQVALVRDPTVVAVCGRIQERFPERSIYNALCQVEWDTPTGLVDFCGGNAMFRVDAFSLVNGFNPALIAGEEPDLCFRLRARNGRILKLADTMVLHDTDLHEFSQWWKRSVRWGYAATELGCLHGSAAGLQRWRTTASSLGWVMVLPTLIALGSGVTPLAHLAWLAYPIQTLRIYAKERRHGLTPRLAASHAALTMVGKVSQMVGVARYLTGYLLKRPSKLIEHKRAH